MDISFLVGQGGPKYHWDMSSLDDGIGGSEECLLRLAGEFGSLGHNVVIYNNCEREDSFAYGNGEVKHRRFDDPRQYDHVDLLISQRDWLLLEGHEAGVKVLSGHDIPVGCHMPNEHEWNRADNPASKHIDKIMYLNSYHRSLSPWIPDDRAIVVQIGIDQSYFESEGAIHSEVGRDRARVLYFSHPNRGLDQLRAVWSQIRGAVPEATLAAFWWEPEHCRPANESLGILPMGRLNAQGAQRECLESGIFGYPCVFSAEISPQTTIIAQAGGCYPVVVECGGMCDTIRIGARVTMGAFPDMMIEYLRRSINGELEDERRAMMDWARSHYHWPTVAHSWLSLLTG